SMDSTGLEMSDDATGQPASWRTLTSHLSNITNKSKKMFYSYGHFKSLSCYKGLHPQSFRGCVPIDLFRTTLHFLRQCIAFHVYRSIQPAAEATTQPASSSSPSTTCCSLGLMVLGVVSVVALWPTEQCSQRVCSVESVSILL
uniref:Uncharacterized protein n=1 Tax=Anabas testudineus TaxID=64144 RepID=A0AAQ6INJ3_ANATE